jgi:hypothetical protein
MTQRIDVHSVNQQIHVTGLDTSRGGSSGVYDGEHVLTGDPDFPPEEMAVGQLLYDGVEDRYDSTFSIAIGVDVEEIFDRINTDDEFGKAMLAKIKEQNEQIVELATDIQELKGS